MTHEEGLRKLAELLEARGLRKHLNINGFGYSQIERDIVSIFIKEQRPFDKLKKLWGDWNTWLDNTPMEEWKSFEDWYGNGNNPNETHQSLAKHCGFATTGEVRRILQHFKNL